MLRIHQNSLNFIRIILIFILQMSYTHSFFYAQSSTQSLSVQEIINQLEDDNWTVRASALNKILKTMRTEERTLRTLKSEYDNEEMRRVLIELLAKEVTAERQSGEGHGDYMSILVDIVASLQDPTALPYFLNQYFMSTPQVIDYLVNLGDSTIVEEIIDKYHLSYNYLGRRTAALEVLADMLKTKEKGYNPTGKMREKIKVTLILASKSENYHTRVVAARCMGRSQDKSFLPILQEMERIDQKFLEHAETGEKTYPVRYMASKALKELQEN